MAFGGAIVGEALQGAGALAARRDIVNSYDPSENQVLYSELPGGMSVIPRGAVRNPIRYLSWGLQLERQPELGSEIFRVLHAAGLEPAGSDGRARLGTKEEHLCTVWS